MSTSSNTPKATTIIFVPGAWHSPECYRRVSNILEKEAGYKTDFVHLSSVGPTKHLLDFNEDVNVVREHVLQAVEKDEYVIMVVHSYGGVPTSQALEGLDVNSRKAAGKKGGVMHIFFCCSFVLKEGQSLVGAFGGINPPWFIISPDQLEVTVNHPEDVFYNDMSEEDVKASVAGLRPHSYRTYLSPLSFAAWKVIPSTYLYCLKDNAIPYPIQKAMIEGNAKDFGFKTGTLDASHSPFFSLPVETANAIRVAAGEVL